MQPEITLFTFPPSQNAIRPDLALPEKGLPFERIELNLLKGEHRQPPLADITPRGQVPTLVYQDGQQRFEMLGFDYAGRTPPLAAYIARCKQRPSVVASGWLDAFHSFFDPRKFVRVLA